ncbi:hypothetical protein ABVQ20_34015 [Mesorhizobium shangrilense]|uniref:Uncharacterized protein n=1 Tax=Mesorhizobium shangrilense TaxID=460060 RepID=A0ABV2DPM7_9HYPH
MAASPSPKRAMRCAEARCRSCRVEVRSRALRKMRGQEALASAEGLDASLLATLNALRLRLAKERRPMWCSPTAS